MSKSSITVRIVGAEEDKGLVRFDDFTIFCRSLGRCLRRVDDVARAEGARLRYRIKQMEASSAALELEPLAPADGPDNRRVVIDLFHETIERIQAGKSVDARFTFDDLVAFRDLATPLQRHSRELWINGEKLTAKYVAQLELILGSAIPSKGQLSGRLERLNVHDRYEFVLFPAAGPRVVCIFDEAMFEEVRNAIKRMVTVSGTLYFQPDRPLPDRVRVDKMEIHPPDDELPKLRDLRATSPNCTGKLTAVDFVRALRDE